MLESEVYETLWGRFDLVVSNPDFEVALQFLCVAGFALDRASDEARIVFLLPRYGLGNNFYINLEGKIRNYTYEVGICAACLCCLQLYT